jgi:hypothetical protein
MMYTKAVWVNWLHTMFKEFLEESLSRTRYEIIELFDCPKTGFKKAVIKLSGRHTIEKNISEIITDADLLEGLDKKTIRTLTYMATVERLKPDYSVVVQRLGSEVDEYMLELQSKKDKSIIKTTPTEVAKDKSLLAKLSPLDANRIGYLAGVRETVKEFNLKIDEN